MLSTIDRGSGPTVLLLHGQPGTGASWDPLIRLLEPEFRVLAPDRAGYGATPDRAAGLAENAELVAALLRGLDSGPATVVAHSWAGGVAVLLASRHPEVVHSLVLVGAACTADSLNSLDRWLTWPVVGDLMTAVGLVGIGTVLPWLRHLVDPLGGTLHRRVASALPDRAVTVGGGDPLGRMRQSFLIEQRALVAELPVVEGALRSVSVPVEVVVGDWDLVVPPASAVTLARAVPGAELTFVPGAGHFLARDDPEALAGVVIRSSRREVSPAVSRGATPAVS
jgi:pimeloyl-ACP methyl ester carboxylesterase